MMHGHNLESKKHTAANVNESMDKIINVIVTHEIHEKSRNYFSNKFIRRSVHIQVLVDTQKFTRRPNLNPEPFM